jgi:hypothetical protein
MFGRVCCIFHVRVFRLLLLLVLLLVLSLLQLLQSLLELVDLLAHDARRPYQIRREAPLSEQRLQHRR